MVQVSDASIREHRSELGSVGVAGQIDGLYDNVLMGWATTNDGEPCEVVVLVNDREIGRTQSARARPDVAQAGLSKGLGGWHMPLDGFLTELSNVIAARFADGRALAGSPITKIAGPKPAPQPLLAYLGAVDSDGPPVIRGWSVSSDGVPATVTLEMDDQAPIAVSATGPRPDLAAGGVSKGEGGWSFDVTPLLKPGTNPIRLRFPNGTELPGSPLFIHQSESDGQISARPIAPSERYRGAIDRDHPPILSGWSVTYARDSAPVTVEINGGEPITLAADEVRPDLAGGGVSNGQGGWSFAITGLLKPGANEIRLRFPDGSDVPGSPIRIDHAGDPPRDVPLRYFGAIDSGAPPMLKGWSVSSTRDPASVTVEINDAPPITIAAEAPRPDLLASLSNGRGGWNIAIADLLKPGANLIRLRFPDGSEFPGSPLAIRLPGGEPEVASLPPPPVAAPPPVEAAIPEAIPVTPEPVAPPLPAAPRPMALTDFDEISLDDLIDIAASGIFDFSATESPQDEQAKAEDAAEAAKPEPPPRRRLGVLSRLLGRQSKSG